MDPRVTKIVQLARKALADDKVDTAVHLLHAATKSLPNAPKIWYYLGTALARQTGSSSSSSSSACICFLRAVQLFSVDLDNQTVDCHQAQQLAAAAADNCWLMANALLPVEWAAAAADRNVQGNMSKAAEYLVCQAVAAAAAAGGGSSSSSSSEADQIVQLLCVGGVGLQALQLAAAVQAVHSQPQQQQQQQQQEGCPTVPLFSMSFIPSGSLTAHLTAQLLQDNDLADVIEICTWHEWQQQQQQQQVTAALLAGCIQPNWPAAVNACLKACNQLAAASSSSSSSSVILSPGKISVWAVPASCRDLLNLNEVDLTKMTNVTTGHLKYSYANAPHSNLRRLHRSCQVSRFEPKFLSDPAVVLELDLHSLLLCCQQQQQCSVQGNSGPSAAAAAAAAGVEKALSKGDTVALQSKILIRESGQMDCLVWWLEFELAPNACISFAPAAAAGGGRYQAGGVTGGPSSSNGSSVLPDALKPHVWQHVQYLYRQQEPQQDGFSVTAAAAAAAEQDQQLPPLYQGQQVIAGQQLLLQITAAAEDLDLALVTQSTHCSSSSSNEILPDLSQLSLQQQQQGKDILPYHMSMLNDNQRTRSYDLGITAAVQDLIEQQQQRQRQQQGHGGLGKGTSVTPVVLDVGCGTGLLSMMAAAADGSSSSNSDHPVIKVVGCERNPVLAAAAQQIVRNNNLQDYVTIIQKLSKQLTVRPDPTSNIKNGSNNRNNIENDKVNKSYDLPHRACLVVHEIFGTDPLSEQVLPALRQVQLELAAAAAAGAAAAAAAAAAAKFLPRAVRIVAALAECSMIYKHLRLLGGAAAAPTAASDQQQQQQWDLSSLLLLLPRKCEMQCDELANDLVLLTQPAAVLEFDFEQQWPLPLNGQVTVTLPRLQHPLLLADWMKQQQQRRQADVSGKAAPVTPTPMAAAAAVQGNSSAAVQGNSSAAATTQQQQQHLCVISWFEADCGAGGWYTTAPGFTRYGHWQQSVEFLQTPAATGNCTGTGGRSTRPDGTFTLCTTWAVDRIKFDLQ